MNWLILAILAFLVLLAGINLFEETTHDNIAFVMLLVGGVVSFVAIAFFAAGSIVSPREVNAFVQQKKYIESHAAVDAVENAALTNKKIELNEWLYNAQYSKQRFGGWSFYGDDIFDLTPIE